ncbi:MAG: CRISPR-associated endonuclease Cas2 [Methanosarcinales archaeon]
MLTLVIYDISDDKKRTRLSKKLFSFGLTRIQYSAFKGELNPHDRGVLVKKVKRYLSSDRDSIYVIPLCKKCFRLVDIVSEKEISLSEERIKIV